MIKRENGKTVVFGTPEEIASDLECIVETVKEVMVKSFGQKGEDLMHLAITLGLMKGDIGEGVKFE